jgi:hypothetical protein
LQTSDSFQSFIAYIQEAGPKVRDLLGAISDAIVSLLVAAAPVGNVMLPIFTDLFKIISSIADSPLGPVFIGAAAAIGLYGRAVAIAEVTTGGMVGKIFKSEQGILAQGRAAVTAAGQLQVYETRMSRLSRIVEANAGGAAAATTGVRGFARAAGPAALSAGLLAVNLTGVADKAGLSNTASLALLGTLGGPWGAALGGAVGAVSDLSNALGESQGELRRYQETLLAGAGPHLHDQLSAATAELEKQQKIIDQTTSGPNFNAFGGHIAPFTFNGGLSNSFFQSAADKRDALKETIKNLKHEIDLYNISVGISSSAETKNTEVERKHAEALRTVRAAAATTGASFVGLGKDVDNTKVSLNDWIRQLQKEADALTAFGENAKTAGERGLRQGLIKELETLGPQGALRLKQLANGSETQIHRANRAFDAGRRAVQAYTNEFGKIPKNPVIKVSVRFESNLKKFTADVVSGFGLFTRPTPMTPKAGGGTDGDPSTPWASGGWTGPGYKYDAKGTVHADEFVFSKEATHGNVGFLSALHQEMRGYASGGQVGAGPSIDYGQLAMALSALRPPQPLYGPVTVMPHDYNDFKRGMEQDRALAGLGGRR